MIDVGVGALWWHQAVIAVIITVVGSARVTRILTHDAYPPAVKFRMWWDKITHDGPWAKLVHCPWCAGPWITLIAIGTFLLTFTWIGFAWAWWLFWGWMTLSYWTSQYVFFDEGRND